MRYQELSSCTRHVSAVLLAGPLATPAKPRPLSSPSLPSPRYSQTLGWLLAKLRAEGFGYRTITGGSGRPTLAHTAQRGMRPVSTRAESGGSPAALPGASGRMALRTLLPRWSFLIGHVHCLAVADTIAPTLHTLGSVRARQVLLSHIAPFNHSSLPNRSPLPTPPRPSTPRHQWSSPTNSLPPRFLIPAPLPLSQAT